MIPTERSALEEFFAGMRGSIHVTFEEGTQAQWLYDVLRPRVARVLVCNRRGEKRLGNKGDRGDADELSGRLRWGGLSGVYHGSGDRADLKDLTRAYLTLVDDGTRVMQRLKALFRARAIRTLGQGVYDESGRRRWLAQLSGRGARLRAQGLYAQLDVLRAGVRRRRQRWWLKRGRTPPDRC